MTTRRTGMLGIFALAMLAGGCGTTLSVVTLEPAPVSFGAADRLSLAEVQARPDVRALLVSEVARQATADGWYAVVDRTGENMRLQLQGPDRAAVLGARGQRAEGEILLGVQVTHWGVDAAVVKDTIEKDGQKVVRARRRMTGEVSLQVTAVDAQGSAPLAESEFYGSAVVYDSDDPPESVAVAAAQVAVSRLLATITPRRVRMSIELDDDDDRQERILELAEDGHIDVALTKMKAFVGAHPNSASALHNLAALLDASGRYDEALPYYDRALASPGFQDFYARNRAGCLRRQAARDALTAVATGPGSPAGAPAADASSIVGRWATEGLAVRFDPAGTYTWQTQRKCSKPPCPSTILSGQYTLAGDQLTLRAANGKEQRLELRVDGADLWMKDLGTGREWTLPRAE